LGVQSELSRGVLECIQSAILVSCVECLIVVNYGTTKVNYAYSDN